MSIADVLLLLGFILLGAYEAYAIKDKAQGDTISERVRYFVRAHPLLAGLFIAFSVWFPLHIFGVWVL